MCGKVNRLSKSSDCDCNNNRR